MVHDDCTGADCRRCAAGRAIGVAETCLTAAKWRIARGEIGTALLRLDAAASSVRDAIRMVEREVVTRETRGPG